MGEATEVYSIEAALTALGVMPNSLKAAERTALDADGYVVLDDVLTPEMVSRLQSLFDAAASEQRPQGTTNQRETGTRHVRELHRMEEFMRVCLHSRILSAVFHVLGRRFVCSFPHGREPLKDFGQQGLHMDWSTTAHRATYYVATAICLLDDFRQDNGATRVVPGSHRNNVWPNRKISDPAYIHPNQVTVTGRAGCVLFFNGHLLHSGTRNYSGYRRRAIQTSYVAYDVGTRIASDGDGPITTDPLVRFMFGSD